MSENGMRFQSNVNLGAFGCIWVNYRAILLLVDIAQKVHLRLVFCPSISVDTMVSPERKDGCYRSKVPRLEMIARNEPRPRGLLPFVMLVPSESQTDHDSSM